MRVVEDESGLKALGHVHSARPAVAVAGGAAWAVAWITPVAGDHALQHLAPPSPLWTLPERTIIQNNLD
jgi:hypothetical protein